MKSFASLPRPFASIVFGTALLFAIGATGCTAATGEDDDSADLRLRQQELQVGDEIPNPDGERDCKGSTNPDGCVDCWAQRDEKCIECGAGDMFCCRHPDKCDVLNEPTGYRPPPTGVDLGVSVGASQRSTTARGR